jgi:PhzF family phenazine biosynthesis protein
MKINIYQIDAFTESVFGGNPAAVCILDNWIDDKLMQNIAAENNLSETAFAVKKNNTYEIRWFTPTVEIDLCGHATLATAFVLFRYVETNETTIEFYSHRSGDLNVSLKTNGNLTLNFPQNIAKKTEENLALNKALGKVAKETFKSTFDYMLVYGSQKEIEALEPDLSALSKIKTRGVMVTAPGDNVDFVSRFFAPASGIDEDPVTGSAHCTLTPYWNNKLKKDILTAKQVSKRGGDLICQLDGDRVKISGKCALYMIGEIHI